MKKGKKKASANTHHWNVVIVVEPEFGTSYVVDLLFSWEVLVRFVDIGGIVDHHCLNFLFIDKAYGS